MCRAGRHVEFEVVGDIGQFGQGGVDCMEMSGMELGALVRGVRFGGGFAWVNAGGWLGVR